MNIDTSLEPVPARAVPEVLERLKAYISTDKRYTVTLKEES